MAHTARISSSRYAEVSGRWRVPRLLLAAVLAVLVLGGSLVPDPAPAEAQSDAQSEVTLVTNVGVGTTGTVQVGPDIGNRTNERASRITTGRNPGGYELASVTLLMANAQSGTVATTISLYSDRAGAPHEKLFTFNNPSNIGSMSSTRRAYTFTAPAQTRLSSGTTYWISALSTGSSVRVSTRGVATGPGEGPESQPEWSICYCIRSRSIPSGGVPGAWSSANFSYEMSLQGRVLPRPLVANLDDENSVDSAVSPTTRVATSFRTGDSYWGYSLKSVTLRLDGASSVVPVVSIRGENRGRPGVATLHTLTNPSNIGSLSETEFGLYTFSSPSEFKLDPNRTYWLVVQTSAGNLRVRRSGLAEDTGSQIGWSIGDAISWVQGNGNWDVLRGSTLLMQLNGDPLTHDGHCDPTDPDEIWCGAMKVGTSGTNAGFVGPDRSPPHFGSLTPTTFNRSTATIRITRVVDTGPNLLFSLNRAAGTRPPDGLLGPGTFTLEIGRAGNRQTTTFNDPTANFIVSGIDLNMALPGLSLSEDDFVPLRLLRGAVAATGAPAISGTASLGQLLTAGTGDIADANGLPATDFPTGYSFQWVRVDGATDTEISGATSRTYRLVAADTGKKVKVKVSFTDSKGGSEERTSEAYPSGTDTISGTRLARLAELGMSSGALRSDFSLRPAFSPEVLSYNAAVYNTQVNQVTLTATPDDPTSTVTYLNGSDRVLADANRDTPGFQFNLYRGNNRFKVRVSNGTERAVYTVSIFKTATARLNTNHCGNAESKIKDAIPAEHWCAMIQLGAPRSTDTGNVIGYDSSLTTSATITGNGFEIDDSDWRVEILQIETDTNAGTSELRLWLSHTAGQDDNITNNPGMMLALGHPAGNQVKWFALADAAQRRSGVHDNNFEFTWSDPGLTWNEHQRKRVQIVERPAPPTSADTRITVREGGEHTFTTSDIRYQSPHGHAQTRILVTSLPAENRGWVVLNGTRLLERHLPTEIIVQAFDLGVLKYRTPGTGSGVEFATFTFKVQDRLWNTSENYTVKVDVTPAPPPINPPYERAPDSFVSNILPGDSAMSRGLKDFDMAQGFRTGPHSGGYILHDVAMRLSTRYGTTRPVVYIARGNPGATTGLIRFEPVILEPNRAAHVVVFTPSAEFQTLAANTDYYVVIKGGLKDHCCYPAFGTSLSPHNEVAEPGWSIENNARVRQLRIDEEPANLPWVAGGDPFMIEIRAAERIGGSAEADPPAVEGTPVLSGAGSDGTWSEGETVRVALTFSESVIVDTSGGTPSVGIELGGPGGDPHSAAYESGSGTTTLTFAYTLAAGVGSHDDMAVTPNSLTLGGGTIRSSVTTFDALLGHLGTVTQGSNARSVGGALGKGGTPGTRSEGSAPGKGGAPGEEDTTPGDTTPGDTTPGDTTAPLLTSAAVDGAELALTFDEALDTDALPSTSTLAVTAAGASRAVGTVTASGSSVTLTLATPVVAGEAVTIAYTAPADESAARLRDLAGNAVASFAGQAVTNDTPVLLTAAAHDVPAHHDGSATITFELHFSEEFPVSYRTLRDHAFTVTGGEVVKANRLEHGKNVRWQIHVAPAGNSSVTIVLPPTTDCESDGAVCTQEGRPLSSRLEVTVPRQNDAPSGAPSIEGVARVGQTLTTSTLGISDGNGVNSDTIAYQWIASDGDSDTEISEATGSSYTLVEGDTGKTIKVRVSFTDLAGYEEALTSAATATVAAALQEGETPALTASVHDVPESHDGSATVTFELRFSEQIHLSYRTLRDHAFTVTGGEVVKARRLERGSSDSDNVRWEISVTPDGNGAVTIVLPPTTDCEAEGALCTSDDRTLSNRLEIVVPGPGG